MNEGPGAGRPGVFLDRDGVVNRAVVRDGKPYPPARAIDVEVLPGVADACQTLHDAGFAIVVVTNQPDVARGSQARSEVDAIHEAIRGAIYLDEIYVCWHDDADRCDCRKPLPGLLQAAARDLELDLGASFMVGDRWRDVSAGRAAGCRTVFIDYHYDEPRPGQPDAIVANLPEAAEWICSVAAARTPEGHLG